jgi:hypothetical protein
MYYRECPYAELVSLARWRVRTFREDSSDPPIGNVYIISSLASTVLSNRPIYYESHPRRRSGVQALSAPQVVWFVDRHHTVDRDRHLATGTHSGPVSPAAGMATEDIDSMLMDSLIRHFRIGFWLIKGVAAGGVLLRHVAFVKRA